MKNLKYILWILIFLFINIPINSILNAEPVSQNKDSLNSRRTYLNWHQGLGLAAWGSWLATNIAGEAKYNEDKAFYKLRDTLPSQILNSYLLEPSNDKILYYTIAKNYHEEAEHEHAHAEGGEKTTENSEIIFGLKGVNCKACYYSCSHESSCQNYLWIIY
jgi:hypothetical protein